MSNGPVPMISPGSRGGSSRPASSTTFIEQNCIGLPTEPGFRRKSAGSRTVAQPPSVSPYNSHQAPGLIWFSRSLYSSRSGAPTNKNVSMEASTSGVKSGWAISATICDGTIMP